MNVYFVTRWGHDESPDGPNGEDTNLLVRAHSHEAAASLVDPYLENMLYHRKVRPSCNWIVELGKCEGLVLEATIMLGPWYAFAKLSWAGHRVWERDDAIDDWEFVQVSDYEHPGV